MNNHRGLRPNTAFLQNELSTNKSFDVISKQTIINSDRPISDKLFDLIEDYCEKNGHKFCRETKCIKFVEYNFESVINIDKRKQKELLVKENIYQLYLNVMIRKGKVIVRACNHRKKITIDLGRAICFNDRLTKIFIDGVNRDESMGRYRTENVCEGIVEHLIY